MKGLIVFLSTILFTFTVLATSGQEYYGMGKIVSHKENKQTSLPYEYFLLIKNNKDEGLVPIKLNLKIGRQQLKSLEGKIVLFRGNLEMDKKSTLEDIKMIEVIDLKQLEELTFEKLNGAYVQVSKEKKEAKENLEVYENTLKTSEINLSDETSHIVFTGLAAYILASSATAGNDFNSEIAKSFVVGTSMALLFTKLKDSIKVINHEWKVKK